MNISENYIFSLIMIFLAVSIMHFFAAISINNRIKQLKYSKNIHVDIKLFSSNMADRFKSFFFFLNVFDYGSKDGLFKFYVILWRVSGVILLILFSLFLIGDH